MGKKSDVNAFSNAMRFLIHYVGDLHQPLHATVRIDKQYPKGDKGGNDFPLPGHYECKELHAVWDKVIYAYHKTLHVPLSDEDWNSLGLNATALIKKWPESLIKNAASLDPNVWAKESFEIASTFVYKGIKENEALPEKYLHEALPIAQKRIVTGGYRLANLLIDLNLSNQLLENQFL